MSSAKPLVLDLSKHTTRSDWGVSFWERAARCGEAARLSKQHPIDTGSKYTERGTIFHWLMAQWVGGELAGTWDHDAKWAVKGRHYSASRDDAERRFAGVRSSRPTWPKQCGDDIISIEEQSDTGFDGGRLTVRPDLLVRRGKRLVSIDYKTTSTISNDWVTAESKKFRHAVYAWALQRVYQEPIEIEIAAVDSTGKMLQFTPRALYHDNAVEDALRQAADSFSSATRNAWACETCPYFGRECKGVV